MSFLRRLLRRQDGITLINYSSTNARMAALSEDKSSAYDLAEAGINEMMAILSRPENNALNKYILGEQANGTVTHTTQTYDGGTVEWWGTLSQSTTGASTWTLTSIGKVKNPTGASASQVTRTLSAKVPVVPSYTQPLNNPSWNFIYSRATGNTC